MVKVITIASIKGGRGKTTIAENLGIVLSRLRRRVLVVDSDLATSGLTTLIGLTYREPNLHDLLAGRGDVNKAICDAYGVKFSHPDHRLVVLSELTSQNWRAWSITSSGTTITSHRHPARPQQVQPGPPEAGGGYPPRCDPESIHRGGRHEV